MVVLPSIRIPMGARLEMGVPGENDEGQLNSGVVSSTMAANASDLGVGCGVRPGQGTSEQMSRTTHIMISPQSFFNVTDAGAHHDVFMGILGQPKFKSSLGFEEGE